MKKYLIYIAIVLMIGFGFYSKVYIPKHTFEVTQATLGDMVVNVNGVGNVGARDIYKVGSVYGGKVLSFNIQEGDFIKKDELIATIDSIDLKDKILEQEANIKKLQNDIKALKLDKQSAITQYDYQEDIYKKNKNLFKKGAISELDFKKYKTNRDVAKLLVGSISSKIDALYSQISQIDANTKGLKSKLLRYTILAPIDGYITKKLIAPYQIINPNQTLIEIVNPKDVWVATYIDTRISGEIKIGNSATIKLRSSNKNYSAKVINIKPVNNSVTNEREIDVSFDNLPIPFYLEEQAVVDIKIKELQNIAKIPISVLSVYDEKDGVWLVENSRAKFKPINILAFEKRSAATNDIAQDDKIIIPNPKKIILKNGMKIYYD